MIPCSPSGIKARVNGIFWQTMRSYTLYQESRLGKMYLPRRECDRIFPIRNQVSSKCNFQPGRYCDPIFPIMSLGSSKSNFHEKNAIPYSPSGIMSRAKRVRSHFPIGKQDSSKCNFQTDNTIPYSLSGIDNWANVTSGKSM